MTITSSDTLEHVGVLGMRWGIRRVRPGGSRSSTGSGKSADHTVAAILKKKKLSQLSNAEIKTLAARIELEKKHRELTQTRGQKARKAIGKILAESAKKQAVKLLSSDDATKYGTMIIQQALAASKKKK